MKIILSFQATPRNSWQDSGRGDANESGIGSPPEKRPRSYSPPIGNHIEPKTDLQESLLGQALEGGPTIHTTPTNNLQVRVIFFLSLHFLFYWKKYLKNVLKLDTAYLKFLIRTLSINNLNTKKNRKSKILKINVSKFCSIPWIPKCVSNFHINKYELNKQKSIDIERVLKYICLNNFQAQSTGEDSNSMTDNEEDTSNNDSILNSVKTEPSDILNDSLEHHRNSFPAALLGLQGVYIFPM